MVYQGLEEEVTGERVIANEYEASFGGDGNVETRCDVCTDLQIYKNNCVLQKYGL